MLRLDNRVEAQFPKSEGHSDCNMGGLGGLGGAQREKARGGRKRERES